MGSIPGLIHTNLAGGVYVKSKEESTAGSNSAHAGDSNATTESPIAISWRRGRGSRDFFQRDEAAVDHLVEADERFTALAAAEYYCLGTPPPFPSFL
jgi:hypothetical protein